MSRIFEVPTKPWDDYKLYNRKTIAINPGVTVLTGCNGISTIAAPIQITSRLSISLFRFAIRTEQFNFFQCPFFYSFTYFTF